MFRILHLPSALGEEDVPTPQVPRQGTVAHQQGEFLEEEALSDGEDGAKPSRCRHCKRGVSPQFSHWLPPPFPPPERGRRRWGCWEGVGKRGSASQETRLSTNSTQPFEHKGGGSCAVFWRRSSLSRCGCHTVPRTSGPTRRGEPCRRPVRLKPVRR